MAPAVSEALNTRVNTAPSTGPERDVGPMMQPQGYSDYPEVEQYPEVGQVQEEAYNPMAGYEQTYEAPKQRGKKRGRGAYYGAFDEQEMANAQMLEITQDQIKSSINQIDPAVLEQQRRE